MTVRALVDVIDERREMGVRLPTLLPEAAYTLFGALQLRELRGYGTRRRWVSVERDVERRVEDGKILNRRI